MQNELGAVLCAQTKGEDLIVDSSHSSYTLAWISFCSDTLNNTLSPLLFTDYVFYDKYYWSLNILINNLYSLWFNISAVEFHYIFDVQIIYWWWILGKTHITWMVSLDPRYWSPIAFKCGIGWNYQRSPSTMLWRWGYWQTITSKLEMKFSFAGFLFHPY